MTRLVTVLAAGQLRRGTTPGRITVHSKHLGLMEPTTCSDPDRAARDRLRGSHGCGTGRPILDVLVAAKPQEPTGTGAKGGAL